MEKVALGSTGLQVSRLGFGAFKIGRNEGIKYPQGYVLPDDESCSKLLHGVLDLGINLIDTAPAYGRSESRIGDFLHARRNEFLLSTKVGETFEGGQSSYDFSAGAVQASVARSLFRLRTDYLDLLLIHSNGQDLKIQCETDCVSALQKLKSQGVTRCIGISPKTLDGAQAALAWADVLMIEYHLEDLSFEPLLQQAARQGKGLLIKKGLGAGKLNPHAALTFLFNKPWLHSVVVGGLNLEHLRSNAALA